MINKKKIAYATGSRADYGIVRQYLSKLNEDANVDFSVLVTGSHLEDRFGKSIDHIVKDGFTIDCAIKLNIDNSNNAGVLQSMAVALESFGTYFEDHKYDLLIILGDRYEMMAVAIAAAMQRIPILHLHGGELTYGNYDEFIRHCITKMSTYHFTSTEQYRKRVIQLGEDPERVFYMGALGAENCQNINLSLVYDMIKTLPKKQYFVVAFHPETLTNISLEKQVQDLLSALQTYLNEYKFIFMGSNADTNSDIITNTWLRFIDSHENCLYIENLNVDSYLFMVKNAIALIGNSSSGIIEAPSLETPTVNIGSRQAGRIHGNSVVDVACNTEEIISAIDDIIQLSRSGTKLDNPYYVSGSADKYYKKTMQLVNDMREEPKEFYDIENTEEKV